ncbi:thioredoxin family protein [Shewanella sp. NIFS-20-20]|uniref:thioredoxin family protein n=1 Tax=Shewanella sp. NIFS-20-20 TaxID=2853806 RepID=UPI001C482FA7|nr:thioredoxin family protein [Shewanella sp. NIFS-20-20]MBV7315861.1 thioredoxin family protein [Shewanella sp. NIFS-20-20]
MNGLQIGVLVLLIGLLGLSVYFIRLKSRGHPLPTMVIAFLLTSSVCIGSVGYFVSYGEDYHAWRQLQWQPLHAKKIPALVDAGYVVIVDITSDWCSICQQNKANVWQREAVATRLHRSDIILMRADATEPDEAINAYLAQEGAHGFPYNKVYGAGVRTGIVLPREVTIADLEQALILQGI